MTALKRRRLTDDVVRVLRERIVAGELPPGTRIDINELAAELEVSQTPVREAILQLETAGLVDRQPYRGTVVTGIDAGRLEEITALRIDLEGRATALGVPRLSDEDVARMRALHEELKAHAGDPDYAFLHFNDLNRRFHGIVYAAADAPSLARLVGLLQEEADRIRSHMDMRHADAEVFHEQILLACERRDADAAKDATQRHLLHTFLHMRGGERTVPPGILADVLRDAGLDTAGLDTAGSEAAR